MAGTSTTVPGLATQPLLPTTTQSLPSQQHDDEVPLGPRGILQRLLHSTQNPPLLSDSVWLCPAYVVDWGVLLLIYVTDWLYLSHLQPFERDVKHYLHDPNLTWPYTGYEQVPHVLLIRYTVHIPLVTLIVLSIVSRRRSLKLLHHSVLGLLTAFTFTKLISDLVKRWVGRLRPDFLDRCQYDAARDVCAGDPMIIFWGRQSFPSGHSAFAFAGLGFVAFWVAGRNGALAIGSPSVSGFEAGLGRQNGPLQSRLLRLLVILPWWMFAAWIAITRLEDHWHHPTDVLAGSLLGAFISLVSYLWYFSNPFDGTNMMALGQPRDVYQHVELNHSVAPASTGERQWLLSGR